MNERPPWDILAALIVGIALGLVYGWVISPARVVDAAPEALRADFKDSYRAAIAAAYDSNGDLARAQARLALLGDADSYQALSAQAQQMLAAGEPFQSVQQVAQLAAALREPQVTVTATATNVQVVKTPTKASAATTPPPIRGRPSPRRTARQAGLIC